MTVDQKLVTSIRSAVPSTEVYPLTGLCQALDGDVVMLSAHVERRRSALTNLQEQLQGLPAFISDLDAITANIGRTSVHRWS